MPSCSAPTAAQLGSAGGFGASDTFGGWLTDRVSDVDHDDECDVLLVDYNMDAVNFLTAINQQSYEDGD